jgi:threonine dehydratase
VVCGKFLWTGSLRECSHNFSRLALQFVFQVSPVIMENDVQFQDISAASVRINGGVVKPACEYSEIFSQATGCKVYLKRETKQYTGSFKERGALNTLLLLTPEQRKAGVIAASAGNHALGLAYHSQRLGIKCTVVMPAGAPLTKISNCRRLGAKVVLFGDHFGQAKEKAMEMGKEEGILFVNGYDDKPIIAGTGTIGLEILQEVPDVDAIIIPVGMYLQSAM